HLSRDVGGRAGRYALRGDLLGVGRCGRWLLLSSRLGLVASWLESERRGNPEWDSAGERRVRLRCGGRGPSGGKGTSFVSASSAGTSLGGVSDLRELWGRYSFLV